MKAFVTTLFVTMMSVSAFAGDNGGGYLECKSSSGRTKLSGMAGTRYNGYGRLELELEIDGKKLKLAHGEVVSRNGVAAVDAVAFDPSLKVYTATLVETISYDGDYEDSVSTLQLISNADSFKKTGSDRFEFKANLFSVDPRVNQKDSVDGRLKFNDDDIKLSCSLDVGV